MNVLEAGASVAFECGTARIFRLRRRKLLNLVRIRAKMVVDVLPGTRVFLLLTTARCGSPSGCIGEASAVRSLICELANARIECRIEATSLPDGVRCGAMPVCSGYRPFADRHRDGDDRYRCPEFFEQEPSFASNSVTPAHRP